MVDRRQSLRRLLISLPVVVSVGKSKSDLVFDLSQGGLSVYGCVPPSGKGGNRVSPSWGLRFDKNPRRNRLGK
jgi:hypothetical protein